MHLDIYMYYIIYVLANLINFNIGAYCPVDLSNLAKTVHPLKSRWYF